MNAKEARALAEQKAPKLEDVLKNIESSANSGNASFFLMWVVISPELIQGLLAEGYTIREHTDPINGVKGLVISW